MQISETRSIIVGGLMVAALAFVFATLSGKPETATGPGSGINRIYALFNKVDGLSEGADVRMSGIKIGSVTTQALDQDYRAIIGMNIDSQVKLTSDTSAAIHTDGLFGAKFVILEPGGEEDLLVSGDMITFTQDALIVSDFLDLIISQGERTAKDAAQALAKLKAIEKTIGKIGKIGKSGKEGSD